MRAYDRGELRATRDGHDLSVQILDTLIRGSVELLPRLADVEVEVWPLDWWHVHLSMVIKRLYGEGWIWKTWPTLFHVLPDGQIAFWNNPVKELPLAGVLELFEQGDAQYVVHAMRPRKGQRRSKGRSRLCSRARERLSHPEPRMRFQALYVLFILEPKATLPDFLKIADDSKEHPRIRALALEGINELMLFMNVTNRSGPEVQSALKEWERLLLDPEPEVRWWGCYYASHIIHHPPLMDSLRRLVDDPTPAGLGWSVGKAAQDAIDRLEGREPPERPMCLPYDPWDVVPY